MPDLEVVKELFRRRDQLDPDKKAIVTELANRFAVPESMPVTQPKELQGPPQGRLQTAIQNLPGSTLNAVTHPSFPGMPVGESNIPRSQELGPTPEKIGQELSNFASTFTHPENDPVGSVLTVAQLARGGKGEPQKVALDAVKGAVKGGAETIPFSRWGHKMNVPASVAGAAGGELMAWPFASVIPHAPIAGAAIGASLPFIKGAIKGGKSAYQDILAGKRAQVGPEPPSWMQGDVSKVPESGVSEGPITKPELSSGRIVGPVEPLPSRLPAERVQGSNAPENIPVGPIEKPTLKSGKKAGPVEHIKSERVASRPDIINRPEDIPVGPVAKPVLASGRKPGSLATQEMPVVGLETKPNALVKPEPTLQPEMPVIEPEAPKAQETPPEKPISEVPKDEKKPENKDTNKQYSWDEIKEKYGSERVNSTKNKLKDLSDRLKAAEIPLEKFLNLPQEAQDALVKIPKHPTQPNRSKYSTGFHKGYSDLLKEIHKGD